VMDDVRTDKAGAPGDKYFFDRQVDRITHISL